MAKATQQRIVSVLLDEYGQTFAHELGVDLERNAPAGLFRMLCLSLLASAPLGSEAAMRACQALGQAGWATPAKMADSTWKERVKVLNENGYARYDEKTADQLETVVEHLQDAYDGDLRRLRDRAQGKVSQARKLLKEFKGIGDVGADIFLREVQVGWEEFRPFADKLALKSSARLELGGDAESLARHVESRDFARLVAALVRVQLAKEHDRVLEFASTR